VIFDCTNNKLVGYKANHTDIVVPSGGSVTLIVRVERPGEPCGVGYSFDFLAFK
jgi:hypothetical protein